MLTFAPEEVLLRGNALFRVEQSNDLQGVIAEKIEDLRHYNVLAMERVVAICCWGRSGSFLLASYLDGHDDVVMLPEYCGTNIYIFFDRYASLSLRDKLLAYPVFQPFFDGDFAILSSQYYAAVEAILEVYGNLSSEVLESRRAFFIFLHIAYNLALGRRPASSSPLIVYAQHNWNDAMARKLLEDFPEAKFIHTVRDPIALCDSLVDSWMERAAGSPLEEPLTDSTFSKGNPALTKNPFRALAAWRVAAFQRLVELLPHERFGILCLINRDRPHFGMESRTLAIRFEDLHGDIAGTMRHLAVWLGLSYRETLLDSTFNGIPYVVMRGGTAWSGRRLEQAQRNPRNISSRDRGLLFALFYKNFVAWNYDCPKRFGNPIVRCSVLVLLFLVPMKMEIIVARAIFKRRILPSLRHGSISIVTKSILRIVLYRLAVIWMLVSECFRRCTYGKTLLQVGHESRRIGSSL